MQFQDTSQPTEVVFVFGSNKAGRHGRGSALEALDNWGAIYGQGMGRQGQSYAIPTKDKNLKVLDLTEIRTHVERFKKYARENEHIYFSIVDIGCGLAGYKPHQIAPLFADAPPNCHFIGNIGKLLLRPIK